jgi:hypothetical protein
MMIRTKSLRTLDSSCSPSATVTFRSGVVNVGPADSRHVTVVATERKISWLGCISSQFRTVLLVARSEGLEPQPSDPYTRLALLGTLTRTGYCVAVQVSALPGPGSTP